MKQHALLLIVVLSCWPPLLSAEQILSMYSSSEVAKHNSQGDCWLIIDSKVYDVSKYIPKHPAPPETILDYCGKEATEPFNSKNKGRPHSSRALKLLSSYLVGVLQKAPDR